MGARRATRRLEPQPHELTARAAPILPRPTAAGRPDLPTVKSSMHDRVVLPAGEADAGFQRPDDRELLTAEEVAALLRVSPGWVYEQSRRRRIPHVRLGRYVRFRRAALDSWLTDSESASTRSAPPRRADKKHRIRSV
jgi:excisionase family DNA binding protein